MKRLLVNFKNVSSDFGINQKNNLWFVDRLGEIFQIPVRDISITYAVGESFQIRPDGYKTPFHRATVEVKLLSSEPLAEERPASSTMEAIISLLCWEIVVSNFLYPAEVTLIFGTYVYTAVIYEVDLFEEAKKFQ